jgi:catechol 2,3-dioxygenase-like lactoylglutathione lyase family enzyme
MGYHAMVKVRRLSHVTLETPDLEKSVDYYTQVNGLALVAKERGRAFLATKTGLLAIELEQGPKPRCRKLAFELAATDFVEIDRELSREGIASQKRLEPAPGIPSALSFLDPNGTSIELFSKWNSVDAPREVIGVGPLKLGHVAFFAPDPKVISDFYRSILGFRVSDWIDDFFVFMRCNSDHHTVNFLRGDPARMHHIAFELKDVSHISNSCDLLARRRIRIVWGPLRCSIETRMTSWLSFIRSLTKSLMRNWAISTRVRGIVTHRSGPEFGSLPRTQFGDHRRQRALCETAGRSCLLPPTEAHVLEKVWC